MITLEALNRLSPAQFVAQLGGVFEHSPWVPARVAPLRPFASRLQLLESMRGAVAAASESEQLALIRAHPRLGLLSRAPLTAASAREQRDAGLQACSDQQLERLEQLNDAYLQKFAFPFILAVRGHSADSIEAALTVRLGNERTAEWRAALREIGTIAAHRLAGLLRDAGES